MSIWKQFRLELGRLLKNPWTWLIIILTVISPVVGLTLYRPLFSTSSMAYITTMTGLYLANPALAGGTVGAVLFAIFTLWELSRVKRSDVDALTDAVCSPMTAAFVRLAALLCVSIVAQWLTMLAWLPYTMNMVGAVFDGTSYITVYLIFMYGALPLAILFAAAAWQFTQRFNLSMVLFILFGGLSLTVWGQNWQLCWLNPCVWAVSDDFSNRRLFWGVAYMRLTWLIALAGLWGISYLCIRRYGKGAVGSLCCNIRRPYRPLLAVLLLCCAGLFYVKQPFVDHSDLNIDFNYLFNVNYLENVTCSGRFADVHPNAETGELFGRAVFQLQNTGNQETEVRFHINPGYKITSVTANGKAAPYRLEAGEQLNVRELCIGLPGTGDIELSIEYGGYPQEWNTQATAQGEPEISSQYMKLENTVLAPTPYDIGYAGDTLTASMDITLPGAMTPLLFGSGTTELLKENPDGSKTWRMMGEGYNMIVYAGDYICEEIDAAGLKVNFYYARKHQPVMEAAGAAESVRQVIEYCTDHYGPLQFYGNGTFDLIQSRVSGGGYAGDGASIADELDFTARNLGNNGKGGSAGEVVIHELVHQWWGLGNMFDPADMDGIWSSEGLTTYTTYRIVKELYGEEEARKNYVEHWQAEVADYYKGFYVRHPEYLSVLPEEYQADISNSLRGVRQYSEMALKILKAEELVGGEEAMDEILHNLFTRELNPEYPYLTYQEFLDACGLTEEELSLD